mgnify:CR=1 FL=1
MLIEKKILIKYNQKSHRWDTRPTTGMSWYGELIAQSISLNVTFGFHLPYKIIECV